MDFKGKVYGAQRESNFAMNRGEEKGDECDSSYAPFIQVVYDVIFAQTATSCGPKRQMSTTKGFKTYGESAVVTIVKEFTQLTKGAVPDKPVVGPVEASTLNFDEKKAMPAINLIKEKWNGVIEGRRCADGSG